jgi:hypothetical protein
MRYRLRLLLLFLAIGPPLGALKWRVVPPALAELRLRFSSGMVEMSPAQHAAVFAQMVGCRGVSFENDEPSPASPAPAVEVEHLQLLPYRPLEAVEHRLGRLLVGHVIGHSLLIGVGIALEHFAEPEGVGAFVGSGEGAHRGHLQ